MNHNSLKEKLNESREQWLLIQAPAHLESEILMKNEFKEKRALRLKKIALSTAAAAAVILPCADGLVYAATGNGVMHSIMVTINGQKQPLEVEKYEEDGKVWYGSHIETGDDLEFEIITDDLGELKDADLKVSTDGEKFSTYITDDSNPGAAVLEDDGNK